MLNYTDETCMSQYAVHNYEMLWGIFWVIRHKSRNFFVCSEKSSTMIKRINSTDLKPNLQIPLSEEFINWISLHSFSCNICQIYFDNIISLCVSVVLYIVHSPSLQMLQWEQMSRTQGESISSERASILWMLPLADRRGALTRAKGTIHSPLLGTATIGLKQPKKHKSLSALLTKSLLPPAQMINATHTISS